MRRRILCALTALLVCIPLTACWDYNGLDTMDIVTGLAIDKDPLTGEYIITFEIVDTQSETGIVATYAEARGETIFGAIRNSKTRLTNKLYGGNAMTMIISHQIARDEGVLFILERFLRHGDPRETLSVAISQEPTAREILYTQGVDSKLIAYEIHDIITEDSYVTASTKRLDMYQVYDQLQSPGGALVLPALHTVSNHGKMVAETNGIAIFRGDRLMGFDTPENTLYYLFAMDEVSGGAYALSLDEGGDCASFEITASHTGVEVSVANGQADISLDIKVTLSVSELRRQLDILQAESRAQAESLIAESLRRQIEAYIRSVQSDVGVDIFGMGRHVYRHQPQIWRSLEDQWDSCFQKAGVRVSVQAELLGFGVIKQY